MKQLLIIALLIATAAYMTWGTPAASNEAAEKKGTLMTEKPEGYPAATFAGGCFWCTESEFRNHKGVLFTQVGYIGGHLENPKYEDTHDSKSGHAEATEIVFDPAAVSYKDLVTFFLTEAHDPTQLNRQGPDTGTQYRSAIFYHDAEQKKIAEAVIAELTAAKRFKAPIVTTLEPAGTFWTAEAYHQQYYEKYEAKTGQPHINDWIKRQKRALSSNNTMP